MTDEPRPGPDDPAPDTPAADGAVSDSAAPEEAVPDSLAPDELAPEAMLAGEVAEPTDADSATQRVRRRRDREQRRRGRPRRERAAEPAPADPRGPLALLVVAGILLALVGIGSVLPRSTGPQPAVPTLEPVDSSTVVCPEPGAVDGAVTTSTVAVVPGLPGQDREGAAEVTYLRGTGEEEREEPGIVLAEPGDSGQVQADARRLPPLAVRTVGSLAPGLVATESTIDSYADGRGLSSTACLGPDTSWWFVGSGSTAGRESNLILVNPESSPAEVDISIAGPDGPIVTPALRGLTVDADARVVVRLTREAPRLPSAAWHVTVRSGRVVAAVQDSEVEGFVARGADWIPPSADPSTRVLIPGIMPGRSDRQLIVHAPGDVAATVRVRLITQEGSYVPTALSQIEVPAGAVVTQTLTEALDGQAVTLELSSDVPIVAGVRQRHSGVAAKESPLDEVSFTAGANLITTAAALTGLSADPGTGVTLWITAPPSPLPAPGSTPDATASPGAMESMGKGSDDSADPTATRDDTAASALPGRTPVRVTVEVLPVGTAAPEPITLEIVPGRVAELRIKRPEGADWYTVVVRPEGGGVVVAHRFSIQGQRGALISGFPWRALRTTVPIPPSLEDISIAVPGAS